MPKAGEGKHCSQCNNIVYDFSQMSDDELLSFFKQKPETHCGRFHNSQLRRDILPAAKPYRIILSRFNKVAAAVFTVLSFKSISSKAGFKNTKPVTVFDSSYNYKNSPVNGISTISGVIREYKGGPLENANVMFEGKQVAVTDKDGKFSFELEPVNLEIEEPNFSSRNIYFSYDSLITAVRTYHYRMFSTSYDVTLFKPGSGSHTMGIMPPPDVYLIGDLPSLAFKTNSAKLSGDAKALLSAIANKLKDHPGANIKVQAYPTTSRPYISHQRVTNIMKYLTEIEGISSDRITTNSEVGGGDVNIVDIIAIDK